MQSVLIAQALASGAMCGLIWFVQVVHYPMFARVPGEHSRLYAREHQQRTTLVVGPLMLLEIGAALTIAVNPPLGIGRGLSFFGLGLVLLVWLSTALVQMPIHARLERDGHDPDLIRRLVQTNWARTALWSARALISVWMLAVAA
jgi:hypothetical protein|tara:strand:- start:25323 stop:25757 length:435 start_codon:yes stop_codon:yes gene_type:complete